MKGFPDLPPIWWLGSIALIYAQTWLLPSWLFPGPLFDMLSWIFLALALSLIAGSAVWFWRKRTPIEPHHTPKNLIVEGPYRLSRNPIYLSLVLLTCASALGHGSPFGIGVAALLWWVLDRRFAAREEALLLRTFGAEAEAYLARTRRWL